jgi:ATP-dependent Clp protease ATP-binding subunit ClpC
MWKPFTDDARRGIILAQEVGQRHGNHEIGAEHILLGITSDAESVAVKVLASLGVDSTQLRQEIEASIGSSGESVSQEMVFTPRAKRVIELAFEESRQLRQQYVGTEHLLLGLIREGENVAAGTLANRGVDPAKVREQLASLVNAGNQPGARTRSLRRAIEKLVADLRRRGFSLEEIALEVNRITK